MEADVIYIGKITMTFINKSTDIKSNGKEAGYRVYQLKGGSKHKNQLPNKIFNRHEPKDPSIVLEIGTGDMQGLPLLLQRAKENLVDNVHNAENQLKASYSNFIHDINTKVNQHFIQMGKNGSLHVDDDSIDYCFTENTLYFWEEPVIYLKEIYRVLKSGSMLSLAFIEKKNGGDLPWTQIDFNFYNPEEVRSFFIQAGFVTIEVKQMSAKSTSINGEKTNRPYILISGCK